MRRTYKKSYSLPSNVKSRNKGRKGLPLVQPAWDDTIHDLNAYKASPEDVLRRKLTRTSHNKLGMALVSQSRSASSGQQARYSPTCDSDEDEGSDSGRSAHGINAQQPHSPTSHQQPQQHGLHHQQPHRQSKQHQQLAGQNLQQYIQQTSGSASVQAQYACSTAGSEDDVCQWQSPMQPAASQQHRQVLQSIMNHQQQDSFATGPGVTAGGKRPAVARDVRPGSPQQQQADRQPRSGAATLAVDVDMMQVLLDKIGLLEQQLQQRDSLQASGWQDSCRQELPKSTDLQQQLVQSQQQLAATQQQLHDLQDEHRQYVAHVSAVLTQLQTQVQQLMTSQQQQQQQYNPSTPNKPLFPAALAPSHFAAPPEADSSRLLQISSFIRQQLQELPTQQQGTQAASAATGRAGTSTTAAAAADCTSSGLRPDPAAVTASMDSAHSTDSALAALQQPLPGASSSRPSASQASAGMAKAPFAQPTPARSSPGRKRSDLVFTPAFADTVPLPSYAAMRQHSRGVAVQTGGGTSPLGAAEPTCKQQATFTTIRPVGATTETRANAGHSSSWELPGSSQGTAAVGSPKRLYTSPIPRPLPAATDSPSGPQVRQQQHWETSSAEGPSLKVPAASAAAAAVWEAELSSPRPQQLLVPAEQLHYHLSKASAETVTQLKAAPVQLAGDLAALLRDLGLASLEIQDLEAAQQQEMHGKNNNAGGVKCADAAAEGPAGRGVSPVLSESAAAPAAALAPSLMSRSRGDGVLAGVQDVDRSLQEGLPRAAVSRMFTAAGCVTDRGAGVEPRPVPGQLKNNMCLRDHLRAAAAQGTSRTNA